jgi:hypothetical protein
MNIMKVRWREHEAILVTIVVAVLMGSYFWRIFRLSPDDIKTVFAAPFIYHHVPFNLYRNVILPDIGMGLLAYLCYLYVNYVVFPRFFQLKKDNNVSEKTPGSFGNILLQIFIIKKGKQYLVLLMQIFLVSIILLFGITVSAYFNFQWKYTYSGFSFFPKKGYSSGDQINIYGNYIVILVICLLYVLYAFVREIIIGVIEMPGGKNVYRTLICNRVTAFLVIYISIPFFTAAFRLVHDSELIIFYYSFVIPVFILVMANIYWLFPGKGQNGFFSFYFLTRLLAVTFSCSILSLLSPFHAEPGFAYFGFLVFQLWIVTPLSWLFYQQQKDKILQLRGAEKALVRSKADLEFLRSQINPHFLFNTLNTLYGTALQENATRTAEAVQKLGEMMRFMLYENNQDFIDMEKEISYIKNYIILQKLRIISSPDIVIEDQIDNKNCNHRIAPMMLIPFIENAFKHGINLDKKSWIRISLDCTATEIHFRVSNSIHEVTDDDPEKEKGGIGNNNVLERLKLIYPGKHSVAITNSGIEFTVQLTILT